MPKLLIITDYFFPDPVVAAVRVTEWCRFLPDHGWQPIVVRRNRGHPVTAGSLAAAVHSGVRVHYVDEGSHAASAARLPRIGPGRTVSFWEAHARQLLAIAAEVGPDVILTTSPPNTIHVAGLLLKQRLAVPWVADFRDAYLFDRRSGPKGIGRLIGWTHRRYERRIYANAALILHAIPGLARWASDRNPAARDRIVFLPNGCPPELLEQAAFSTRRSGSRRSVRVVGKCGADEAVQLARAVRSLAAVGTDLELRIVGYPPATAAIAERILGDRLVLTGPRPHPEALREIAEADVLVAPLSVDRSQKQGVSSKLFEYLAAGRPVIAINPTGPDREVFSKAPGVEMLFEPSAAEIESAVLRALATGADVATSQREFAAGFRRDHQTARLAAMLDALVSDRAAPKKTAAPGAPFFSVVIPVHNKAPHVHRSVTSVLNQSFQDFEVIAIDDASTDGSLAEIQQFADSRIRILRRGLPGPGGYAARNLGIREARAEWIALLDADDEWLPDHLEKMSDLARQFPGSSILSSGWTTVLPGNRRVVDPYFAANRFRGPHTLSFGQYLQESINTRRPIHTSVACLKRTSETARNVFPEGRARRGGDLHAWVMVLAHGTMAWSAHLGAVYYRDTVNMVTRSVPLSVDLHRAVVEDVRPFVGKSEIKLLRKYSNRRIFAAWLGQRLNGNAPYNVPANLMWKGDALYCLTRSVVSFIPVGALKRMRSLRRLTRR